MPGQRRGRRDPARYSAAGPPTASSAPVPGSSAAAALLAAGLLAAAGLVAAASALVALGSTTPAYAASTGTPLAVTPAPCGGSAASAACTEDPATVAVAWPSTDIVGGVTLAWVSAGRPSSSPAPATADEGLPVASASCATSLTSGATTCTWSWPAALRHPSGGHLLNGTYQVTACSNAPAQPANGGSPSCSPSGGLTPAAIAVGVVPAAPAGVSVSGSRAVTVRWSSSTDPDLAGYRVARDGTPIYSCAANGAGGNAPACPATPSAPDAPPAGHHTYTVTALAFGTTPSSPLLVSPAATVGDTVTAPVAAAAPTASQPDTAGGAAPIALGPVPYVGPPVTLPAAAVPAVTATTTAPVVAPDSGFAASLPYQKAAVPSALPLAAAPGAPREAGAATSSAAVHRTALFALGMLILAIAAHLIFIKGEIARRDALWRALRHAAGLDPPAPGLDPPTTAQAPPVPAAAHAPASSALEGLMLWHPGAGGDHRRHRSLHRRR